MQSLFRKGMRTFEDLRIKLLSQMSTLVHTTVHERGQIGPCRTYCRGGPPWPPGVERNLGLSSDSLLLNRRVAEITFDAGRPRRAAPTVRSESIYSTLK